MGIYLDELLRKHKELNCVKLEIQAAVDVLVHCFETGGKVLICGNGGSAADCEHIAGELQKGFMKKRPLSKQEANELGAELASRLQQGLPAIPLVSNAAILTAIINDLGADLVFAQQVQALGQTGDVLIGLSTSGNAENVVNAFRVAHSRGMKTISMTGQAESRLSALSDVCIRVPAQVTPAVQEWHLPVYHVLCAEIETYFYAE